tara:strand:- start:260 stop:1015 length:756 start_codon:yes stop_codon:yes gene_type:complete
MTLIVNLSTTHCYSVEQTIHAFVQLCKQYHHGCLKCMPGFFEDAYNYLWVMRQYQLHYKTLIEPYKLGRIDSDKFLDNLATIFPFMDDLPRDTKHKLLTKAWNASISIPADYIPRLTYLVEQAQFETVYLISNTNELNMQAINACWAKIANPELKFKTHPNLEIKHNQQPVEILPNVFLCLSYRYGLFKAELSSTVGLLETLVDTIDDSVTVVSQFEPDIQKAQQLQVEHIYTAQAFFEANLLSELPKKTC